ncbi:hypothetical protein AB205_0080400 [Aquarana catesbeiana]|uniref:Uncharacterized protein n=1 Tax=Aquarana catesbeiana TaxID=8400 RepID=A0A2G9SHK8_AQUCT|nr:hypothetical protein AB205_0080400 [Aquarana catesbeiana]
MQISLSQIHHKERKSPVKAVDRKLVFPQADSQAANWFKAMNLSPCCLTTFYLVVQNPDCHLALMACLIGIFFSKDPI